MSLTPNSSLLGSLIIHADLTKDYLYRMQPREIILDMTVIANLANEIASQPSPLSISL